MKPPVLVTEEKRYINALILSSCAFPGAGQLMQKRWLSGTVLTLTFLVPFALFTMSAVKLLIAFYKAFPDPSAMREANVYWLPVGKYFLMTGVVWVVSILDIYIRRRKRR